MTLFLLSELQLIQHYLYSNSIHINLISYHLIPINFVLQLIYQYHMTMNSQSKARNENRTRINCLEGSHAKPLHHTDKFFNNSNNRNRTYTSRSCSGRSFRYINPTSHSCSDKYICAIKLSYYSISKLYCKYRQQELNLQLQSCRDCTLPVELYRHIIIVPVRIELNISRLRILRH